MKTRILLIGAVVLGWAVCAQAEVLTYNAANNFSASNNPPLSPNDVWRYGYASNSAGPAGFTPYGVHETGAAYVLSGIDFWDTALGTLDPSVSHNGTASTVENYGITWEPNALCLDGPFTDGSYIRWTAPAAGALSLDVTFKSVQASSHGYVLDEGSPALLWDSALSAKGVSASWSHTWASIPQGYNLYFAATGGYTQLGASLTLTTVPEPATLVLLATGLLGLLAYAWRKRR